MATIREFKALRPQPEYADKVAALPYDVLSADEARNLVSDNPLSFLHVDKAEIDLDPGINPYDSMVYKKAGETLNRMISDEVLIMDTTSSLYIYRLTMNSRSQTGLVCCTSVDEYISGIIKKHELTREDKEIDRIKHVDITDANTGPIFLAYRNKESIRRILSDWIGSKTAEYDFVSEDGIRHEAWVIDDTAVISELKLSFESVESLYIADGHHRNASAVKVALMRRQQYPDYDGTEEFNYYLSVLFPDDELNILDYNRIVKDLNKLTDDEFMQKLSLKFDVTEHKGSDPYKPEGRHMFGLFFNKKWYKLRLREQYVDEGDVVLALDVSIIQKELLQEILAIGDPRTDKRIDFVGGIRGLHELEKRVCEEDFVLAISMNPTSIAELMQVADHGKIMPPKSTWFEPKLRSGLFIHRLS